MRLNPFALAKRHLAITFIISAFIVLGTIYSVVTPIFEASDEISHYPVVKHIADGQGLPVQNPEMEHPWRQEGSQPPLYYVIAALVTSWIDTDDMTELLWYNPHARIGLPLAKDNKNMVIHVDQERFPYQRTALAVHIIRFLSVFMEVTAVLLTYLISLEIFPGARDVAAGAAAIVAFNPMFLFIAGSVNNDNLVIPLSSLALLLMTRMVKNGASMRCLVALGAVIGFAALSKLSALGLLPLAVTTITIVAVRQRSLITFVKWSAVVLVITSVIAGWWFVRNWTLYRDPLGLNVMLAIAGERSSKPTFSDLIAESEGFKISYWALFGAVNVLADPIVYAVYDAITVLSGIGLLLAIRRHFGGDKTVSGSALLVLALWIAILFASLVQWTQMTKASQGRLLFPAISAISIFLSWGLTQLVPRRFTGVLAGGVSAVMLILAIISPFRYIAPAYARPPLLTALNAQSIPHRVHINYEGRVELMGYETDKDRVEPGDVLELTLYWRCLAEMDRDYSVFIHLLGRDEQLVGQRDTYPGRGTYPTSLWRVGDIICDKYEVPISPDAAAPSSCRVEVGLYTLPTFEGVRPFDREGRPLGSPIIGWVKIAPEEPQSYAIPNPIYFNLADKVALVGYDLEERAISPGETLHLTLFWQVLEKIDEDCTVFTHLVDEGDRIWGQRDSQPLSGYYPTSLWDVGEVIKDDYELVVQPEAPPGKYILEVGMYLLETGKRLAILDEEERGQGDRVLLSGVQVIVR